MGKGENEGLENHSNDEEAACIVCRSPDAEFGNTLGPDLNSNINALHIDRP